MLGVINIYRYMTSNMQKVKPTSCNAALKFLFIIVYLASLFRVTVGIANTY